MNKNSMKIEELDSRFEMEMLTISMMAADMTGVSADQAAEASCCENYTCTFSPQL
ncbi:MAG: hypothetical protein Q4G62_01750 [Pseudomonadota bacterium]|nr:hypothetical protein [Pseudomonadota bacterium]